jgi:ABC-type multidrug transport system fused ATPase/permease subunit
MTAARPTGTDHDAAGPGRWELLRAVTDRTERRVLAEVAAAAVVTGLADAATLVGISTVAVALTRSDDSVTVVGSSRSVGAVVAFAAIAALVRLVAGGWGAHRSAVLAARVLHRHRRLVVARFVAAPWTTSSAMPPGTLQQLALQNTQVASANVLVWTTGLTAAITLVVFGVAALVLQPVAAAAVILLGAVAATVMRPIARRSRLTGQDEAAGAGALASDVSRVAATDLVTSSFHTGDAVVHAVATRSDQQAGVYRRGRLLAGLTPVVFQSVVAAAVLGGLAVVRSADVTDLAAVGAVALLALRSMGSAQGLQQAVQTCDAQRGYLRQLLEGEEALAVQGSTGSAALDAVHRLEAVDVEVTRESGRHRLGPLHLVVERHEFVGIGGPSGAGKSTLLEVLVGVRRPTAGTVLVNGTPIEQVDPVAWAGRVAFVPQQPVLVDGTVADNVRWFRHIDHADVRRACSLAALDAELAAWPEGLDTPVGDGGAALSVGQRQRVCLARALAGRPDVVVLDEPTASLDAASETAIAQALGGLRGQVTVVLAAHGTQLLAHCDRVVQVRDGTLD